MGIPSRPKKARHEGPATSCVISGVALGWTNCTPESTAMGVSKTTLGRVDPSGCGIRIETGDRSGGTTIPQCAAVVEREWRISVEVRVGSNVATPVYLAAKLKAGCGHVAQGNAGALLSARALDGTRLRSTAGYVNHAVWVNEGRGWHKDSNGHWIPTEVLVYDPAADGRHVGWGTADTSPSWWPWSVYLHFLAALRPWGDQDSRTLGSGKAYAMVFPSSEPHAHLRYSGQRTTPFPDHTLGDAPAGRRSNIRSSPSSAAPIVGYLARGAAFTAYQVTTSGSLLAGSRTWYGDHNGTKWVHSSGLRAEGGTT